jgi:hypothetical protein
MKQFLEAGSRSEGQAIYHFYETLFSKVSC